MYRKIFQEFSNVVTKFYVIFDVIFCQKFNRHNAEYSLSKAWNFTKNLMDSLKDSLEVFKNSYRNILCSLSKKYLELLHHFKVCQSYTCNDDADGNENVKKQLF